MTISLTINGNIQDLLGPDNVEQVLNVEEHLGGQILHGDVLVENTILVGTMVDDTIAIQIQVV